MPLRNLTKNNWKNKLMNQEHKWLTYLIVLLLFILGIKRYLSTNTRKQSLL